MQFGLIGKTLGHSYSKIIHAELCNYQYDLTPLPTEQHFKEFMQAADFSGINVTIPYKKDVMQYCEYIDSSAKVVGAVNTIVKKGDALHGFNTDYDGFAYMARRAGVDLRGKHVMILGTGGTSVTAQAVALDLKAASVVVVSRSAVDENLRANVEYITYDEAPKKVDTQVVINTTPVGMYPKCGVAPIDLLQHSTEDAEQSGADNFVFPNLQAVLDVIYNPVKTKLLADATQRAVIAADGLSMLVAQAKYAADIFTGVKTGDEAIEKVLKKIRGDMLNLVIIGMPGCGKSHVGSLCAKAMGRSVVDVDSEIVKRQKRTIADIFEKEGEEVFRGIESDMCAELGKLSGAVICTGGGAVLRNKNVQALSQNGIVIFLQRDIENLQLGNGRPLSTDMQAVKKIYEKRLGLYKAAADATVENKGEIDKIAKMMQDAFYAQIADK